MVKLTKIYTRTGDAGETHLAGGHRIAKTSGRIHAIGDIDELNSWFGMIVVELKSIEHLSNLLMWCEQIQQQLFNLGAQLAILAQDRRANSPCITQENIDALEQHMDTMNEQLPTLTSFILPGGNRLSASMHIARSVCRRAERALCALHNETALNVLLIQYVNRLSDWLFVAARYVCQRCQVSETLWV